MVTNAAYIIYRHTIFVSDTHLVSQVHHGS